MTGKGLVPIFALLLLLVTVVSAWGYPVPSLPAGNLLVNPWFRSYTDPTTAGLDGWENVLADGAGWGTSQKDDNPSPERLVAEACDYQDVFCGTSARWANVQVGGVTYSYPGVDVYLYQVVAAPSGERLLRFSMYWVNHRLDVAEVIIQGGSSPNGPWEEVWLPISIAQDQNPPPCCVPGHNGIPWFQTGPLQTILAGGYPYYRVILHARYPEAQFDNGDVGVKITGVYFSTAFTWDRPSLSTPVVVHNPTADLTATPGASPSPDPTATRPGRSTPTLQPPTPTSPPPTEPGRTTPTASPTPTSRR